MAPQSARLKPDLQTTMQELAADPSRRERSYLLFWLWQLVPLVWLMVCMPPGSQTDWWFFAPWVDAIAQHPSSIFLGLFFVTTWSTQGIVIAIGIFEGEGRWYWRILKGVGLYLIAALVPVIWIMRHLMIFQAGLRPWSEVLNPMSLAVIAGWFSLQTVLPTLVIWIQLYFFGWRIQRPESNTPIRKPWQFSLWGICAITLVVSVALAVGRWLIPVLLQWIPPYPDLSVTINDEPRLTLLFVISTFVTLFLAVTISTWRMRSVLAIFGLLVIVGSARLIAVLISLPPESNLVALYSLDTLAWIILGQLIALAIQRYWLGWPLLVVVRTKRKIAAISTDL